MNHYARVLRGFQVTAIALLLLCAASSARADELELKGGEVLRGELLGAGPTRVLFSLRGSGHRFLDKSAVVAFRDASGQPATLPEGRADPSGILTTLRGPVRVIRAGVEVELAISDGPRAVVFEGDEVRTDPQGKVAFRLVEDAEVHAWDDAVLRIRDASPELLSGRLQLATPDGRAVARITAGRVEVVKGTIEAVHLRGRTRLRCLAGRARLFGQVGYILDLPQNHVVDVTPESPERPAALAASTANAWALKLQIGTRRVQVQRGERVVLLGAPEAAPPAAPPAPSEPLPALQDLAGRVISAESSFALLRPGEPARRVEPAQAEGLELSAEDRLQTDAGAVLLECGEVRLRLAKASEGKLEPGRGVPFRVVKGQLELETARSASVALPGGELGLLSGSAVIAADPQQVRVGVSRGTGGLRLGDLMRAELLAPAELLAREEEGDLVLSLPKGSPAVPLVLGGLDLRLDAARPVRFRGSRELEVTSFDRTRIELAGGVRVRIAPGAREGEVIQVLDDGREFPLGPGTYRFYRRGKEVVAELPKSARPSEPAVVAKAEEPGPAPAAPQKVIGKLHTLPNGAVVITRNWGPLVVRPPVQQADGQVVVAVAGPKGDVTLEPKTKIILTRLPHAARLDLPDGRFLLQEDGASIGFTALVRRDGVLRVAVGAGQRSVEVEPGVEFDLSVRKDDFVLTYVFGQALYLEPRQQMRVTQREGLRLRFAREQAPAQKER